eukprot:7407302-Pyramimonas_sp.AAC.1
MNRFWSSPLVGGLALGGVLFVDDNLLCALRFVCYEIIGVRHVLVPPLPIKHLRSGHGGISRPGFGPA